MTIERPPKTTKASAKEAFNLYPPPSGEVVRKERLELSRREALEQIGRAHV